MEEGKKEFIPSSLLQLKAELLQKQEEAKKGKLLNDSKKRKRAEIFKKTSVWNKTNVGVLERASKDLEAKAEEEDIIAKSKKQLEAKARVYDSLTQASAKSIPEEDGSRVFLVDFQQKAIHSISEKREQKRLQEEKQKEEAEEERRLLQETVPEPDKMEEEWVDYVDSFGRSRRCMRKDLPELQKMDSKLQGKNTTITSEVENGKELMSADMQRELIRQKWETLEKDAMINPDGPMHYANVQFNEIRTHGTGYYQFSKAEEQRKQQMDALKDLRDQTKDTREKKEKLKQKKKAIMKARLVKVKRRKLIREGKNPEDISSESDDSNDDDGLIGPSINEKSDSTPESLILTRDEKLKENAPVREWDIGKSEMKIFSEEKWLEERRTERLNEFAPPQMYYDSAKQHKHGTKGNDDSMGKQETKEHSNSFFAPSENKSAQLSNRLLQPIKKSELTSCNDSSSNSELHANRKDPMVMLEATVTSRSSKQNMDPMALLESQVETKASTIDVNVAQRLHSIRFEMEQSKEDKITDHGISVNTHSLDSIPLPKSDSDQKHSNKPSTNYQLTSSNIATNSYDSNKTMTANESDYYKNYYNQFNECHQQYGTCSNQEYNIQTVSQSVLPKSEQNLIQTENSKSECTVDSAPQPAHFSSAPTKFDVRYDQAPRYQRVNLYDVPDELPAPISAVNVPQYPSMEDVIGLQTINNTGKNKDSEVVMEKQWYKQFDKIGNSNNITGGKESHIDKIKPVNIPFVSPYVQKDATEIESLAAEKILFDPAKPPPKVYLK